MIWNLSIKFVKNLLITMLFLILHMPILECSFILDVMKSEKKLHVSKRQRFNVSIYKHIQFEIFQDNNDSLFYEAYTSDYSHENRPPVSYGYKKKVFLKALEDKKIDYEDSYKSELDKKNYGTTTTRDLFRELNGINVYMATTQNPKFPEDWEILKSKNKTFERLKKDKTKKNNLFHFISHHKTYSTIFFVSFCSLIFYTHFAVKKRWA